MAKKMNKNKIYRYSFACYFRVYEDQSLGNILFTSEVGYENWKDALVGLVKAFGEAVKLEHFIGEEYKHYRPFCCRKTLELNPSATQCTTAYCKANLTPVLAVEPGMATEAFSSYIGGDFQSHGGDSWQIINDHGWRMAGSSVLTGRFMDIPGFEDYLEVFFDKGETGLRKMLENVAGAHHSDEYELKPAKKTK